MRGDTPDALMWGLQSSFRRGVETALQRSLDMLGVSAEPTVYLIGLLRDGRSGHPASVEPEDGPIMAGDFDCLRARAVKLYDEDPDTAAPMHRNGQQEIMGRAHGTAIGEVLEARLAPDLRFFVGLPVPVDQRFVFTAIGLPTWVLDDAPRLSSVMAADRYRVTQSLAHGAVEEVLRLSSRALYEPYAGADADIGVDSADVARAAGRALTRSAVTLSGNTAGPDLFDGMNRVATTRYERRVGIGSEPVKAVETGGWSAGVYETL